MRLEVIAGCGDVGGATLSVADSVLVELVGVRLSAFEAAPSVFPNEHNPFCRPRSVICQKKRKPF